jgi:aminoglycoside phosphotransferase (APT) family kinase protein
MDTFLDRYGERLSPVAHEAVSWLRNRLGAYLRERGEPRTITHGDFRTDNLLFDGRGGEVPIATVDWQTVGIGPGAIDLAYLLTTSLDTSVRVEVQDELIEAYHDRLGALGVTGYPLDALRTDYARHAFQGVLMLTCAAVLVEQTDRGDAMFLAMIERSATAVRDLGTKRLVEA